MVLQQLHDSHMDMAQNNSVSQIMPCYITTSMQGAYFCQFSQQPSFLRRLLPKNACHPSNPPTQPYIPLIRTNAWHIVHCCCAYSGLLHCRKFTSKSNTFKSSHGLLTASVMFIPDYHNTTSLNITIPSWKTVSFRWDATILLSASPGLPIYPIAALQQVLSPPNSLEDHFSPTQTGPDDTSSIINILSGRLELHWQEDNMHFISTPATVSIAAAGCREHKIQQLGQQRSDTYCT